MTENDDIKIWFSQEIENLLATLYGVALRLTRNGADAQDLVADSVSRAWSAIQSLTDRGSFRPWLFRILRNQYISNYRKKAVRPTETNIDDYSDGNGSTEISVLLMEQSDDFLNWWANPEHQCINSMLGEQIRIAIDSLPEVFRTTVLLINVEGLTYDETAAVLGVPKGTVRSRMKRGRTQLQKQLWEQAVEHGLVPYGANTGSGNEQKK